MQEMDKKRNDEMEPHTLMELGVPRGKANILANVLGVGASLVTKWRREPASDESPNATGTPNPIERVDRIFDFFLIYSPGAAQILASRYQSKLDEFYSRVMREPLTEGEWRARLAQTLRENAEAIAALIENASPEVVRREWEQAKLKIEELVRRREAGECS
jgi:hypothetical protein